MVGSEWIDVTAADHVGSDRGPAGWIAAAQPFSPKLNSGAAPPAGVHAPPARPQPSQGRCRSRLADGGCR